MRLDARALNLKSENRLMTGYFFIIIGNFNAAIKSRMPKLRFCRYYTLFYLHVVNDMSCFCIISSVFLCILSFFSLGKMLCMSNYF